MVNKLNADNIIMDEKNKSSNEDEAKTLQEVNARLYNLDGRAITSSLASFTLIGVAMVKDVGQQVQLLGFTISADQWYFLALPVLLAVVFSTVLLYLAWVNERFLYSVVLKKRFLSLNQTRVNFGEILEVITAEDVLRRQWKQKTERLQYAGVMDEVKDVLPFIGTIKQRNYATKLEALEALEQYFTSIQEDFRSLAANLTCVRHDEWQKMFEQIGAQCHIYLDSYYSSNEESSRRLLWAEFLSYDDVEYDKDYFGSRVFEERSRCFKDEYESFCLYPLALLNKFDYRYKFGGVLVFIVPYILALFSLCILILFRWQDVTLIWLRYLSGIIIVSTALLSTWWVYRDAESWVASAAEVRDSPQPK